MIYDTLDPYVAEWLKTNKPPPGLRWHQQLTENYGARRLVSRCYEFSGMKKTCTTIRELREKVAHHYGKEPMQSTMYLPKQSTPDDEAANCEGLFFVKRLTLVCIAVGGTVVSDYYCHPWLCLD